MPIMRVHEAQSTVKACVEKWMLFHSRGTHTMMLLPLAPIAEVKKHVNGQMCIAFENDCGSWLTEPMGTQ